MHLLGLLQIHLDAMPDRLELTDSKRGYDLIRHREDDKYSPAHRAYTLAFLPPCAKS